MSFSGPLKQRLRNCPEAIFVRLRAGHNQRASCFPTYICRCLVLLACLMLAIDVTRGLSRSDAIAEEGIRVEMPEHGQLLIENRFGDVSVEVTKAKDLLVRAYIVDAPSGTSTQSPVVIERKNGLLLISAFREPGNHFGRVNLTVKLPDAARAEVVTTDGAIISRGVSTSLSLRTISGQ